MLIHARSSLSASDHGPRARQVSRHHWCRHHQQHQDRAVPLRRRRTEPGLAALQRRPAEPDQWPVPRRPGRGERQRHPARPLRLRRRDQPEVDDRAADAGRGQRRQMAPGRPDLLRHGADALPRRREGQQHHRLGRPHPGQPAVRVPRRRLHRGRLVRADPEHHLVLRREAGRGGVLFVRGDGRPGRSAVGSEQTDGAGRGDDRRRHGRDDHHAGQDGRGHRPRRQDHLVRLRPGQQPRGGRDRRARQHHPLRLRHRRLLQPGLRRRRRTHPERAGRARQHDSADHLPGPVGRQVLEHLLRVLPERGQPGRPAQRRDDREPGRPLVVQYRQHLQDDLQLRRQGQSAGDHRPAGPGHRDDVYRRNHRGGL